MFTVIYLLKLLLTWKRILKNVSRTDNIIQKLPDVIKEKRFPC